MLIARLETLDKEKLDKSKREKASTFIENKTHPRNQKTRTKADASRADETPKAREARLESKKVEASISRENES